MFCSVFITRRCRLSLSNCCNLTRLLWYSCATTVFKHDVHSYSNFEGGKYMQKLLNKRGGKAKKKWYQPHVAEPLEKLDNREGAPKKGVTESQRTRARQLSHVLYEKITHSINTGELSQEILEKQVLITSVKVHPNFSGINVYWDSNRQDADSVEALLRASEGKLRGLLISYHVLGRIPVLIFVKDNKQANISQLNKLFEVADYGPDYTSTHRHDIALGHEDPIQDSIHSFCQEEKYLHDESEISVLNSNSHQLSLKTGSSADSHWNHVINSNAQEDSEETPIDSKSISQMSKKLEFRSNLYGLDRANLLKKVMTKKSPKRITDESFLVNSDSNSCDADPISFHSEKTKSKPDPKKFRKSAEKLLRRDSEDF